MAGVKTVRRVLGAVIAAIGVTAWVSDLFLVQTLPYSEFANDSFVAIVPLSGAVLVAGGTLLGLWS
ncbi:SepZ protein [Metallosphaera tengchongensis]|uniref:SepZ protein n=1 Tax=Metallosphaera tengchongensis TaxID=1532350 RepID=A0A6N0NXR2_9CREN|nr:SepZ protein [Metallosphaera tengchongensis]QKR01047.1 SepZ protein [Metallosphaera tengchongensis]